MKKTKPIILNWRDIIKSYPIMPKGYLTANQIAERTGHNISYVSEKLREARKANKIDAIKAKSESGRIVWFYKE